MGEMKDAHIVEIPVDEEHQQKQLITAIQNHPLTEISHSPGHLLLLKLWQREEDLSSSRIASKESRLDSTKQEIFQLCSFFLLFHAIFSILLFTSSLNNATNTCDKWWIPSLVSLSTSLVFVFLVQVKVCRYWKVWRQLNRERQDGRAIARCIQELRMKGSSFDLSREPLQSGKRLKSSSVVVKWKPFAWCSQNLITFCLVCFTDSDFLCSFETDGTEETNVLLDVLEEGMKHLVRISSTKIFDLLRVGLQRFSLLLRQVQVVCLPNDDPRTTMGGQTSIELAAAAMLLTNFTGKNFKGETN